MDLSEHLGFCSKDAGKLWGVWGKSIHDPIYILEAHACCAAHTARWGAEWAWRDPLGDGRNNPRRVDGRMDPMVVVEVVRLSWILMVESKEGADWLDVGCM